MTQHKNDEYSTDSDEVPFPMLLDVVSAFHILSPIQGRHLNLPNPHLDGDEPQACEFQNRYQDPIYRTQTCDICFAYQYDVP